MSSIQMGMYKDNLQLLEANRKAMLPYSSLKKSIETLIANEERAAHVFDTINPIAEQENFDNAENLEPLDLDELPQENDEQHSNNNGNIETCSFKPIQFGKEDEMIQAVKTLAYEQRIAFDIFTQFCKKKKIQRSNPSFQVMPVRMIVTGKFYLLFIS